MQKAKSRCMGCHPGNYVIEAEQFDQEKHYHVRQKLVVGDEKVESVILTLGRGTTMYGHLGSLGPMPKLDQVRVALELIDDSQEESFDWAEIKKDGSFLFFDVADGSYALWFARHLVCEIGAGRGDDLLQKGLQVEKGSSPGAVELTISSISAQLEGTVTDRDKPVAAALVRARADPETAFNQMRSKTTTTDQNGHFTLTSLAAGKYRVIAKLPAASADLPSVASEPTSVALGEGEHQRISIVFATPQD